jgi:polar amino acid transport system permease protein
VSTEATDPAPRSAPPPNRVVPVRHYGRWVSAAILIALVVWLVDALSRAAIDYGSIPGYLHDHAILVGARNTLIISVLAQAMGIVLGIVFAVMRLSRNPVVGGVSWFYIWFFRGTPVLVQLFFWFNLSIAFAIISIPVPFTDHYVIHESTNSLITPFIAALLGLGINEGAYMAEIIRAGIISVDEGQSEAAASIGMTRLVTMRRVILPQAMRVIIPPTGNEFINMLKTSSLASVVTYQELYHSANDIYSQKLNVLELLITISIWYLALTTIATIGQYYLERYYARGSRNALPLTPRQKLLMKIMPSAQGRT